MTGLTPRQRFVLETITRYQVAHDGLSPSMREIAGLLHVRSYNSVLKHVTALLRKGALSRTGGRHGSRRSISITPNAKRQLVQKWTAALEGAASALPSLGASTPPTETITRRAFKKGERIDALSVAGEDMEQWSAYGITADVFAHGKSITIPLIHSTNPGSGKLDAFIDALKLEAKNAGITRIGFSSIINAGLARHLHAAGFRSTSSPATTT